MKTLLRLCLLLIVPVVLLKVPAKAQEETGIDKIFRISELERTSFRLKNEPRSPLIGDNYDLKYHRFFWEVEPPKDTLSGSVTSWFVTKQSLNSIQFEFDTVMIVDSAVFHGYSVSFNHSAMMLTVFLTSTIPAGSLDSVTVYYHGNPGELGYQTYLHQNHPGINTFAEPFYARYWWPTKNDLTDKIDSIDVYVAAPVGNRVASHGLLVSETPNGSGKILTHWKHRYPIVSYLVAFAVSNYVTYSDWYVKDNDSLQILNYVFPEDSATLVDLSPYMVRDIRLYDSLFCAYPFNNEKYGQVEIGNYGMENQTMTFLDKGMFADDVAGHELAHHWFGDMITCGSWHDIWLNEGFATYCDLLRYEYYKPHYWFLNNLSSQIQAVTSKLYGSVYCVDTTSYASIFDPRLSYYKGALLLHMLRWKLGDDVFFEGMREYVNDPSLQYNFAHTIDFKEHMENASGVDLDEFFNDWFTGEGYPSYQITTSLMADNEVQVTINQTQSHPSVSFFEMPVPIKFSGEGLDTIIVFNNTYNGQVFTCNPGFETQQVTFDPEYKIISRKNTMIIVGVENLAAVRNLSISPNPANKQVSITFENGDLRDAELFGNDGKLLPVEIEAKDSNRLLMDISLLPEGLYLLKLQFADGAVTRKIVISRQSSQR